MNVLVDTNVWLDLILLREPHLNASANAIALLDQPAHNPYLAPTSVTTIFYLVHRETGPHRARQALRMLLQRTRIAPIDGSTLIEALSSDFDDYEDAVLDTAASQAGLDAIVTRNTKEFSTSALRIFTPAELVAALQQHTSPDEI